MAPGGSASGQNGRLSVLPPRLSQTAKMAQEEPSSFPVRHALAGKLMRNCRGAPPPQQPLGKADQATRDQGLMNGPPVTTAVLPSHGTRHLTRRPDQIGGGLR